MQSIETRDKMHLDLTKYAGNRDLIEKYKTYRNKLNKLIIKQKKEYFQNQIQNNENCSKTLWKISQDITNARQSNTEITEIKIANSTESNQQKIANAFNLYYTEIGLNMAKKIKKH